MTAGSPGSITETFSLLNPDIQCPDLPSLPVLALSPASFTREDVPILCGGDYYDTECYRLINDGTNWIWEYFTDMLTAAEGPGYANLGDDLFFAGSFFAK